MGVESKENEPRRPSPQREEGSEGKLPTEQEIQREMNRLREQDERETKRLLGLPENTTQEIMNSNIEDGDYMLNEEDFRIRQYTDTLTFQDAKDPQHRLGIARIISRLENIGNPSAWRVEIPASIPTWETLRNAWHIISHTRRE